MAVLTDNDIETRNPGLSRRGVMRGSTAALLVAAAGNAEAAPQPPRPGAPSLTPDQAFAELMAGNARFVAGVPTAHLQDLAIIRAHAAEGQWPIAGVLACADSRVPVEMVFDEPMGRLFVTRIAGNITTPEIIASLEYGVAALSVKVIVVMGHSSCGAVKAAMQNSEAPGQISALVPALLPAVYLSKSQDPDTVSRTNATVQAATLINASTVIEQKVRSGDLMVVPAIYEVSTGKVLTLPIPDALRLAR
jgi:carbonic anhydrase